MYTGSTRPRIAVQKILEKNNRHHLQKLRVPAIFQPKVKIKSVKKRSHFVLLQVVIITKWAYSGIWCPIQKVGIMNLVRNLPDLYE